MYERSASLRDGPGTAPPVTTVEVFNGFLMNLAKLITDIIAPSGSDLALPDIDEVFFSPPFWHAHLVYASDLASPEGLEATAIDTLAGDQLCQWSAQGVNTESLLGASHLTVFLPPRVGAYLLANHTSHSSLTIATTSDRTHFIVRQHALFRANPIFANPKEILSRAPR